MIEYIHGYKKQFEEDWNKIYTTFRDNKYDEFFPGISDPKNEAFYTEHYHWAFNAGVTRFVLPEFYFKLGTFLPWVECTNHRPYECTEYRVLDANRNVIKTRCHNFTDIESYGLTDFEFFYSRNVEKVKEERTKKFVADYSVLKSLEEMDSRNVNDFAEADKEPAVEYY
jgi:hypothetical protein